MKSKPLAYLIIVGLFIGSLTPADKSIWLPYAVEATSSNRSSPKSLMAGGEQNIDNFVVNPIQRWNNYEVSGGGEETTNGFYNWKSYLNESNTSMQYYREMGTVETDISTRIHLNATADYATAEPGWHSEYHGDFQVDLIGLNISTTENISLSAFNFNETHYLIRPSVTTDENQRSWNLESSYQDYAQLNGSQNADGWDFIEGTDDFTMLSGGTISSERGYINCSRTAADSSWGPAITNLINFKAIEANTFDQFEIKIRAKDANINNLRLDWVNTGGGPNYVITLDAGTLSTNWTTYTYDLSQESDWINTPKNRFFIRLDTDAASWILIDSIRLLTTNDTSDLQFYEYETFYRPEFTINSRNAELEFKIKNDEGTKLVKEEIGSFSIADYFNAFDLQPDVFEASMGSIDAFFQGKSAASNISVHWDFIEAEFGQFQWEQYVLQETGNSFISNSPHFASVEGDGGTDEDLYSYWSLCVPEFDSASGSFTLNEEGDEIISYVGMGIYSVDASDGSLTNLVYFKVYGCDWSNAPTINDDATHELEIDGADTAIEYYTLSDNRNSQVGFTTHFDKDLSEISLQIRFENTGSDEVVAGVTADVSDTGNEFVIYTMFGWWSTSGLNSPDAGEVLTASLDGWSLTSRDLFSGIKKVLPNPFKGAGNMILGALDFLLAPLIAILNVLVNVPTLLSEILVSLDILALIDSVLDSVLSAVDGIEGLLTSVISELTSMENWLGIIDSVLDTIDSVLDNILGAVDGLEGLLDNVFDTLGDMWGVIETWVADVTAAMWTELVSVAATVFDAIWTAFVNLIRDISLFGLVTLGDLLDFFGTVLDLVLQVISDFLTFATMIVNYGLTIVAIFFFLVLVGPALMARKGNWKDLYDMYTGILNFEWPIQVGIIYGPNIRNWMVVGPLVIWAIIIALVIPGEVPNPIWR